MEDTEAPSLVEDFDSLCFSVGDQDAIVLSYPALSADSDDGCDNESESEPSLEATCYVEIQEYSKQLANQLVWRYRPDFVLVDCLGWPAAEAAAVLACMRIRVPFVPVSCHQQHRPPGRLDTVVDLLRGNSPGEIDDDNVDHCDNLHDASVVAITVCEDDHDPILAVFQQAGVHQIIYVDKNGNMKDQIYVPSSLPQDEVEKAESKCSENIEGRSIGSDDLYVMFTSQTTSGMRPKAVIGSHESTKRRVSWFHDTFESSERVGRRSPLTFVDGVTELLSCLLDPESCLVAVPPQTLASQGVKYLIQNTRCTQLLLLPSQLAQLTTSDTMQDRVLSGVERLMVSGEPCTSDLVRYIRQTYPKMQLINLYGQTETTGDCCAAILSDMDDSVAVVDEVVCVGKPIPNHVTEIHLAEETGELMIGGSNLSNGYLYSERVRFHHFASGDRGFCRDGNWYVQGRIDDVIKRNGIWTSPQEVQAAISQVYFQDEPTLTSGANMAVVMVDDEVHIVSPDETLAKKFSRKHMNQSGVPWNLIPKSVICSEIPISSNGSAGKVDRNRLRDIVRNHSAGSAAVRSNKKDIDSKSDSLTYLVALVLKLKVEMVDTKKSFVELGGESALAISLLYQLHHLKSSTRQYLTAIDILECSNLVELQSLIEDGPPSRVSKRRRLSHPNPSDSDMHNRMFEPLPSKHYFGKNHIIVSLSACVDARPLVVGDGIYSACQGGVILKVGFDGSVVAHRQFASFMIQAAPIQCPKSSDIIISMHSRSGHGKVARLSEDLHWIRWEMNFDGPVTTTPIIVRETELWVLCKTSVHTVNFLDGKSIGGSIALPAFALTEPVVALMESNPVVVYASADWESGLMVVDDEKKVTMHFEGIIMPVHKDMSVWTDGRLYVADSCGSLHMAALNTMKHESLQVSGSPLSSPLVLDDSRVLVGSYDGFVRCCSVRAKLEILWTTNCRASIYARPALLRDGTILVTTTAGDAIILDGECGNIKWRYRIPAEIWSEATELPDGRVSFGARDSCLHIVSTNTSERKN